MAGANELHRLLGELRKVSSPIQRLKLLARAWRSLRRLGVSERRALAREVGIDGAEEILEKLAVRKAGMSVAAVQQALEKLRESDLGQIRELAHGLRDPEQRKEMLGRRVRAAVERIAGPEPLADAAGVPEEAAHHRTPPAEEPAPRSVPPSADPGPLPVRSLAERAEPEPAVVREPGKGTPKRDEPRATVAEPAASKPPTAPVVADRAASRSSAAPAVAAEPASQVTRVATVGAGTALRPERTREPVGPEPDGAQELPSREPDLLEELAEEPMLIRRFRLFREQLDRWNGLSLDQLRRLLELFPSQWARRRVLDALLEAGIPGNLHQAVFLIETLESEAQQRWCVRTVLEGWDLSAEERRALLDRHGLIGRQTAG